MGFDRADKETKSKNPHGTKMGGAAITG